LTILTVTLLFSFGFLFVYLKRVSEIVSPSKSIWYILDKMIEYEIKNYHIVESRIDDNQNGENNKNDRL